MSTEESSRYGQSAQTLDLYLRDISVADKEGRNLTEESYTMLFKELGYNSIAEVEKQSTGC